MDSSSISREVHIIYLDFNRYIAVVIECMRIGMSGRRAKWLEWCED